jgi:Na+-driven multidrug efflux pump
MSKFRKIGIRAFAQPIFSLTAAISTAIALAGGMLLAVRFVQRRNHGNKKIVNNLWKPCLALTVLGIQVKALSLKLEDDSLSAHSE